MRKKVAQNDTKTAEIGSRRAKKVLAALLETGNVTEAAAIAGVGRSTVYRLLRTPAFSASLERARSAAFSDALGRLKASASAAVERLTTIVKGQDPEEARRAAATLLTLSLRAHELIDVESRIVELEALVAAAAPPSKHSGGGG